MEEPNLTYINELAGNDSEFKTQLIQILKKELPSEIRAYQQHIVKKNNNLAAEMVHKIKHKISILGLLKSHKVATHFEEELKNNSQKNKNKFDHILKNMTQFLNTI
jgi:HPt (histidine-containing phosphotransfer) domain-containing protein